MWLVLLSLPALMLVFTACRDATNPVVPASVAQVSLTPATIPIVKGEDAPLTLSAADSAGNELRVSASWTSSAPAIATVSPEGVVTGVAYGTTVVTAAVGTHSASANVTVTTTPASRSYAVLDLGAALQTGSIIRQLSDSGDVVAGSFFRRGVATSIPGCGTPVTVNGPGHVLCKTSVYDSVSSYAIWREGVLTPLTPAETFEAGDFRAFAMSDSDEVAGMFWRPSFVNAGCPASGDRCLAVWENGTVRFPGYTAPTSDAMLMNGTHQVVVEQPGWVPSYPGLSAMIIDVVSGARSVQPWGIHALNDHGWAAIELPYLNHGSTNSSGTSAIIATPTSTIGLGSGGATGINNENVVVGTLDIGPFIWRGDAVSLLAHAATDPSWTITAADEINSRGQILATADNSDGRRAHTVILTPTGP